MKLSILSRLLIAVVISSLVTSLAYASCKCKPSDNYEELMNCVKESFANSMWDDAIECLLIAMQKSPTPDKVNEVFFSEMSEYYYKTAMNLKKGKEAFDKGMWDDAIKFYEKVMQTRTSHIPNKDNDEIISQIAQSYYKSVIKLKDAGGDMDDIRRKIARIARKTEKTKQGNLFYLADLGLLSLEEPVDIYGVEVNLSDVSTESQHILLAEYYLKNNFWSVTLNTFEDLRVFYEKSGNTKLEAITRSMQALVHALEIRDSRDDPNPNDEIWGLLENAIVEYPSNNEIAKWLIGWIIWYVQEQYDISVDDVNDLLPEWLIKNEYLLEEVKSVYSSVGNPLNKEMFPTIKITDKDVNVDVQRAENLLKKVVIRAFYNLREYFNELQESLDKYPPVIEVFGWNNGDKIKTNNELVRVPLVVHDDSIIEITWKIYKYDYELIESDGKQIKKQIITEIKEEQIQGINDNDTIYYDWFDIDLSDISGEAKCRLDIIASDIHGNDQTFQIDILYKPQLEKKWRFAYIIGAENYGSGKGSLGEVVDYDVAPMLDFALTVGGFLPSNINVWIDTEIKDATKDRMKQLGLDNVTINKVDMLTRDTIDAIITQTQEGLPKDCELLFYYSGHGINDDHVDKLLLNGTQDKLQDRVFVGNLLHRISNMSKPKRTFFILDACYSGGGLTELPSVNADKERYVITGATAGEKAKRVEEKSVLTDAFIHAVKKNTSKTDDTITDGYITSDEVLAAMKTYMHRKYTKFMKSNIDYKDEGANQVVGFVEDKKTAVKWLNLLKDCESFNKLVDIEELNCDKDVEIKRFAIDILLDRARLNIDSNEEAIDLLEEYYKFDSSLEGGNR